MPCRNPENEEKRFAGTVVNLPPYRQARRAAGSRGW